MQFAQIILRILEPSRAATAYLHGKGVDPVAHRGLRLLKHVGHLLVRVVELFAVHRVLRFAGCELLLEVVTRDRVGAGGDLLGRASHHELSTLVAPVGS